MKSNTPHAHKSSITFIQLPPISLYISEYIKKNALILSSFSYVQIRLILFPLLSLTEFSMGSLVSIENLADPQAQQVLRGHDMEVSALAVAPSGKYVASGQVGTKHFKGVAAPVFLWDVQTTRRLLVLRGLTVRVNILAFSTGMYSYSGQSPK